MKKNIFISTLLILTVLSCSKDDDHPEHVHEHELITTMTITLTPSDGFTGDTITLQMQDLDGDGPNAPTKSVSGNLLSGVFYDGAVVLLNESVMFLLHLMSLIGPMIAPLHLILQQVQ